MFFRRIACSLAVLGTLLLPFFCLLYVVLPSPEISLHEINSRFLTGEPIVRAFESDEYFLRLKALISTSTPKSDFESYAQTFKDFIILTFQYHPHNKSLTINNVPIPLDPSLSYTSSLLPTPPINLTNHIITGNTDGIALPWFSLADATLLSYQIHHEEVPNIYVKLFHYTTDSENKMYILPSTEDGLTNSPETHLLAVTFDESGSGVPRFTFPEFSLSPTTTYVMRSRILSVLASVFYTLEPFGEIIWFVVRLLGYVLPVWFVVWVVLWDRRKLQQDRQSSQGGSNQKDDAEILFDAESGLNKNKGMV